MEMLKKAFEEVKAMGISIKDAIVEIKDIQISLKDSVSEVKGITSSNADLLSAQSRAYSEMHDIDIKLRDAVGDLKTNEATQIGIVSRIEGVLSRFMLMNSILIGIMLVQFLGFTVFSFYMTDKNAETKETVLMNRNLNDQRNSLVQKKLDELEVSQKVLLESSAENNYQIHGQTEEQQKMHQDLLKSLQDMVKINKTYLDRLRMDMDAFHKQLKKSQRKR